MKFPRAAAKLIPTIPAHANIPMRGPPNINAMAVSGIARTIEVIANPIAL